MGKRLFDISFAVTFLFICSPLFLLAFIGILLTSPGPVFYQAKRIGFQGNVFTMYKFRTMHRVQTANASKLTMKNDPRIFPFGSFLRKSKIDELPQFVHILSGSMSVVGPRPEDPEIYVRYFKKRHRAIYSIKPGLFSPASIYEYTHGSKHLHDQELEKSYENYLDLKVALDMVYIKNRSLWYDIRLLFRCAWTILLVLLGKSHFPNPPELGMIDDQKRFQESING